MKTQIKIEAVPITDLKPSEYNPRRMTEEQEKNLTESITRFGLIDPIIVNKHKDRKGVIVGGHQRFALAKKLKYKEVPVVYLDLSLEQEKELNLRLNSNGGEWDLELLKRIDLDLLMDVGFDDQILSDIWDASSETEDDGFEMEKEIEKAKETTIKTGDLFQLGKSRLICGDSTNPEVVKKLVGNEKMDISYCDPPYNINLDYNKGIGGNANYGGDINDNKTDKEYEIFIKTTLQNALSVSNTNAHFFYYCDQRYVGLFQKIYKDLGIKNERTCLWIKCGMNVTPNNTFNKAYEPCVYGKINKPYVDKNIRNLSEVLNKEIGVGNRTADDILDLLDIWVVKRLPGNEYLHSTQKPTTLHEKPIKRCSRPGHNILDLFGGSGSTLLAAEQLKRKAFVCEINPIFIQLIINRYEQYSNKKAIKLN